MSEQNSSLHDADFAATFDIISPEPNATPVTRSLSLRVSVEEALRGVRQPDDLITEYAEIIQNRCVALTQRLTRLGDLQRDSVASSGTLARLLSITERFPLEGESVTQTPLSVSLTRDRTRIEMVCDDMRGKALHITLMPSKSGAVATVTATQTLLP